MAALKTGIASLAAVTITMGLVAAAPATADGGDRDPNPGSPAYTERDARNINNAYGRITGPGGQVRDPDYLAALTTEIGPVFAAQLLTQAASPTRLALTPGNLFPGWNLGNPLRAKWHQTRGRKRAVAFTNKFGALLRGTVWAPKRNARDPYTNKRLRGPYPGVVITTGSVQGSQGMYEWLAQDLAERGYVVLTYDVQGQGESETLPNQGNNAFPFCNPFATPKDGETFGCPGVPAQQLSNFEVGTRNALGFFTSTPKKPWKNRAAKGEKLNSFNPFWRLFDSSFDPKTTTPGRGKRIAIIGHSLGAAAVSKVQAYDRRVAAVVALDKLVGIGEFAGSETVNEPVVPALAVQSEYGFTVSPWFQSGGSSLMPEPSPGGPNPRREAKTGFNDWKREGVDSMLIVPRASTHIEYSDVPLALPASRFGQALTSAYTQRWLNRYLKHKGGAQQLLRRQFRYLEPRTQQRWAPVSLKRGPLLSFYYCSGWKLRDGDRVRKNLDIKDVGCRAKQKR